MAVVCEVCKMRTEMPERHKVKYARVHELISGGKSVEAALRQVEQEKREAEENG